MRRRVCRKVDTTKPSLVKMDAYWVCAYWFILFYDYITDMRAATRSVLKTSVGLLVFVMVCLVWWKGYIHNSKSRGSIQGLSILPLPNTKLRQSVFRHGFGIQDKIQRTTLTGMEDGIRRSYRTNDTSQKDVLPQNVGIRYKPQWVNSRKNGGTIRRYAHKAGNALGKRVSPLAVGIQNKSRQINDTEKSYEEKRITKELRKESPEHLLKQVFDIRNNKTQRTPKVEITLAKRRSNQTIDKTSQEPVLKHSLGKRTKTQMLASKRKGDNESKLTKAFHNKSYAPILPQAFDIQTDKTQRTRRKGKNGNGGIFNKRFHYKSQAPVIPQAFGVQSNSQKTTDIWKDDYGKRANRVHKNSQNGVLPLAFGIQNKPQRNPGRGMVDIGRRFTKGFYNKSHVPEIRNAFGFQYNSRKATNTLEGDRSQKTNNAHNYPQQAGLPQAFGIQNKPQRKTGVGMFDNGRGFAKQFRDNSQVAVIPQAFGFPVKSRKVANTWQGANSQRDNVVQYFSQTTVLPLSFGIQNKPQRKTGIGMVVDSRRMVETIS